MVIGANTDRNSLEYWDERFETNWENNRGRAYSRNYAELAFSRVPQWLIREINRGALSLCDWGCAMGDGTAYLANMFSTAKVTGVDFSDAAVGKARAYYPHVPFECENWLSSEDEPEVVYDIVFSSHTLEHFGRPWDVLEKIAPHVGRALIVVVPFQEKDLIAEHCYSFDFGNILFNPSKEFVLVHCDVIESDIERKNCWNGRQALLVYVRWGETLLKGLTLADTRVATGVSDTEFTALGAALERKDFQLEEKDARFQRSSAELEKRDAQFQRLRVELEKKDAQLQRKKAELEQRQRQSIELKNKLRLVTRQYSTARKSLLETKAWVDVLDSSVRFKIGDEIVGARSNPLRLFKLPYRIVRILRDRGSHAALPAEARIEPRKDTRTSTERELKEAGASAKKAFVYDLEGVAEGTVRERDIGYLLPPVPPPPPQRPVPGTRVASILDEFSDQCFRYEADLVRIAPDTWLEQLRESRPEFLLVESAWHGNGDAWRKMIESCDDVDDNPLFPMLDYCRAKDIPTVFWNKEDPPNFEHFIAAAGRFDYVFTSDRECIPRYRELLGHDRIKALPFAAQPQIHNPIGKRDSPLLEVGFAGTWYVKKHEERRELLRLLLDAGGDRNLHIFDRMSEFTGNDRYRYPERFSAFLHTALPYDQMLRAYRDFRLFLNVNSVLTSSTMFARRVLEVLACQTNVVSTTSEAVERMLGDVVTVVDNEPDAREAILYLLNNESARLQKAQLGWRKVMREHTYARRFNTIAETIGIASASDTSDPLVSVLVRPHDQGDLDRLLDSLGRQTYPKLEILVADQRGVRLDARLAALAANHENVRLMQISGWGSLTDVLVTAAREARGSLLTLFDSRDRYGAEFLWDLVTALAYSQTDSVGKASYYAASAAGDQAGLVATDKRFRHVDRVPVRACLVRMSLLLRSTDGWRLDERENLSAPAGWTAERPWGYGSDAFNYLRNAHAGKVSISGPTDSVIALNAVDT